MLIAYSIIITLILAIAIYVIWNLNRKVKKQEEVVEYQVGYLRNVSYLIQESKLYVEKLDESGAFQADDELGVFFNFMKEIQETINTFRLPKDYGEKSK